MKKIQKSTKLDGIKIKYFDTYFDENFNNIFVDIETTGVNRNDDIVFLIGTMVIKNSKLIMTQWFCDKKSDERKILMNFINNIHENSHIITFNGNTFDIPFLNSRLKKYNLPLLDDKHIYTDIYTWVKSIHFDGIENKKLKTIVDYMDIHRIDNINSPELKRSYQKYIETKNIETLENILLHNYEDVYNLYELWVVNEYMDIALRSWLTPRISKNKNFIYKFKIIENQLYIIGIFNESTTSRYVEIYKGNYIKIKNKYFETKINLLETIIKINTNTVNAKILNIHTIKDDFNLVLSSKNSAIKLDNSIQVSNIEELITRIINIKI